MKILLLSGSHSRHLFYFKEILNLENSYSAVVMKRESIIPKLPEGLSKIDEDNYIMHFKKREEEENLGYGTLNPDDVFGKIDHIFCDSDSFHSNETINFIKNKNFDICLIFGTDMIRDKLFTILPKYKINLHLGISPYYKGSATLFWPFHDLMPQFAGATFHQISPSPDAGEILHHSVPLLEKGDTLHRVAVNTVKKATADILKILNYKINPDKWNFFEQKSNGKIFMSNDFHASHLKLIYNTFNDDIVDHFLNGDLSNKMPKLINFFKNYE